MNSCYGSSSVLTKSAGASCDVAPRSPTVTAEIKDLHTQLQALDDVTGKLRQILDPLMVNRPQPAEVCAQGVSPIPRCTIAGEIHAAVDLACNITAKCNDMLCCLDL